ncbi:hypothetical protein LCGC14_2909090, partial [marine sediment metagenome]
SLSAYPVKHALTNNSVQYNAGMTNALWNRILEVMEDMGLPRTQTAVAKICGITQPSVQRWAVGENLPTLKQAVKFGMKTGVRVDWIYTGRGAKHPVAKPGSATEVVMDLWYGLDSDDKDEAIRHLEYLANRNSGKPVP